MKAIGVGKKRTVGGGRPENGARMGFKLSCISDNNAGGKEEKRRENRSYIYLWQSLQVNGSHSTHKLNRAGCSQ